MKPVGAGGSGGDWGLSGPGPSFSKCQLSPGYMPGSVSALGTRHRTKLRGAPCHQRADISMGATESPAGNKQVE